MNFISLVHESCYFHWQLHVEIGVENGIFHFFLVFSCDQNRIEKKRLITSKVTEKKTTTNIQNFTPISEFNVLLKWHDACIGKIRANVEGCRTLYPDFSTTDFPTMKFSTPCWGVARHFNHRLFHPRIFNHLCFENLFSF